MPPFIFIFRHSRRHGASGVDPTVQQGGGRILRNVIPGAYNSIIPAQDGTYSSGVGSRTGTPPSTPLLELRWKHVPPPSPRLKTG